MEGVGERNWMMTPSVLFLFILLIHPKALRSPVTLCPKETVLEGREGGRAVAPRIGTHSFVLVNGIVYFLQNRV